MIILSKNDSGMTWNVILWHTILSTVLVTWELLINISAQNCLHKKDCLVSKDALPNFLALCSSNVVFKISQYLKYLSLADAKYLQFCHKNLIFIVLSCNPFLACSHSIWLSPNLSPESVESVFVFNKATLSNGIAWYLSDCIIFWRKTLVAPVFFGDQWHKFEGDLPCDQSNCLQVSLTWEELLLVSHPQNNWASIKPGHLVLGTFDNSVWRVTWEEIWLVSHPQNNWASIKPGLQSKSDHLVL